jgi:predicted amidophosphoribosyltransferase
MGGDMKCKYCGENRNDEGNPCESCFAPEKKVLGYYMGEPVTDPEKWRELLHNDTSWHYCDAGKWSST